MIGGLRRLATWPFRTWRQSLPFRAVSSCLAVAVVLWSLTGWLIVHQVDVGVGGFIPVGDREEARSVVRWAVAVSALISLPVLAASIYVISLQIARPLRAARRAAEGLASGDAGRLMPVVGPEDSAALARAINHMAAELSRRLADLDAMARQQHQFVSDVAHELRTPMTTVRMAADVIYDARADLPPVMARSSELLSREVDRFEALLHDLLDLSRIDAGAAVLALEDTDIVALVRDEVASHQMLAATYSSQVTLDAPVRCVARVDAMRVRRIVVNLLTNAIEHGEGRPIEVYVRSEPESVTVAVRDHGVGLTREELAQAFTRFWRADPSRFRTVGGTGLGLAIALENAELHGGRLDAWGAPQEGAQFRLRLPVEPGQPLGEAGWPLIPPDAARPASDAHEGASD